jgi:hypothetical protein
LERVRPVEDLEGLAASCFSLAERDALAAVSEMARLEAFFDGWTRKEAFLKLLGDGLSRPLDSFDVTLAPGEPARLLRVAGGRAADWTLHAVEVGPGYRGALALEGTAREIRLRDWALGSEKGSIDERRGSRGHDDVHGGHQPRGAVLDLAGRQGDAKWLARCGEERVEEPVSRLGQGGLDRSDSGEPSGHGAVEGLTHRGRLPAGVRP